MESQSSGRYYCNYVCVLYSPWVKQQYISPAFCHFSAPLFLVSQQQNGLETTQFSRSNEMFFFSSTILDPLMYWGLKNKTNDWMCLPCEHSFSLGVKCNHLVLKNMKIKWLSYKQTVLGQKKLIVTIIMVLLYLKGGLNTISAIRSNWRRERVSL